MKILTSTVGMTEDDWQAFRRRGIGGSDAAAALGVSKWKSKRQLYMEKMGEYDPVIRNSEAIYWGKTLEAPIAQRFAELNPDVEIRPVQAILVHPEIDYMFANIDREIVCPTGNGVLEIKTANARQDKYWEGEDVPADYIYQVQHYLAVTGYKFAWIACLLGGQQYIQRYIERDEALIDMIYKGEAEFWEYVMTQTPPEWDGSEASEAFMKKLAPEPEKGKQIVLPDEMLAVAREYEDLKKRHKEYADIAATFEQEMNARKEALCEALGDAEIGTVGNYTISSKLTHRKECYVAATSYRRFSFKAA